METLFVTEYQWFYMPSSVHKIEPILHQGPSCLMGNCPMKTRNLETVTAGATERVIREIHLSHQQMKMFLERVIREIHLSHQQMKMFLESHSRNTSQSSTNEDVFRKSHSRNPSQSSTNEDVFRKSHSRNTSQSSTNEDVFRKSHLGNTSQSSTNEDVFRKSHSRNTSQSSTNENVFNLLPVFSDPLISGLRIPPKKSVRTYLPEALKLFPNPKEMEDLISSDAHRRRI